MLTGRDCFGVCEEYNCTDCQDKAKEVYEGIVQDALGEFVEWLKDQPTAYTLLIYDRNKRKYLNLNEALEKFLEEKEK